MVGTHIQLNTAVGSLSSACHRRGDRVDEGTRDGTNLNLTAGGVIFQRSFPATRRKAIIIIVLYTGWDLLFQHVVGSQRRRAGQ